jgi:hypothetical protein
MHQMPGQAKAQIKDFVPPSPLPLKRKHPQGNKVLDDEDEKEYDDLDIQQALDSLQEVCQVSASSLGNASHGSHTDNACKQHWH